MSNVLEKHINQYVKLDPKDFPELLKYFVSTKTKKKQDLSPEGKVSSNFFVAKGCIRMFFVNDKGIEQTVQFAIENWWLSDYMSFSNQKKSEYTIQAVENSEVLALDYDSQEKLLERFPEMERYFRLMHQRALAASQHRIKVIHNSSREQLYLDFAKRYPGFVQRVPQYLLASFLGFTPEYLSEIRKKRS
jgi:CRP-like cAMP-binding protein